MNRVVLFFVCVALGAGAGCKPAPKITPLDRKQAANLASEAQFVITLREWARAEKLYTEAVQRVPDDGDLWLQLGVARRRSGDARGAKQAYERALKMYTAAYKKAPAVVHPLLQEVYALGLLGRIDDAREKLAEARRAHPDAPEVRNFTDRAFDEMLADSDFKALSV